MNGLTTMSFINKCSPIHFSDDQTHSPVPIIGKEIHPHGKNNLDNDFIYKCYTYVQVHVALQRF